MTNLNFILDQFVSDCRIAPYGDGHINDTYLVDPKFILQRINTKVFKDCLVGSQQFKGNWSRLYPNFWERILKSPAAEEQMQGRMHWDKL